jgi:F-type H+-transporting ATPase subunit beta
MNTGTITRVIGAVVDCEFTEHVPEIYNALKTKIGDKELILEVQQHLTDNQVRTIGRPDFRAGWKRSAWPPF